MATFVEVKVKSSARKKVFNGRTIKGLICYSALTTTGPVCVPCVLAQDFRGKETRMSSKVFVQTMRTLLSLRTDA